MPALLPLPVRLALGKPLGAGRRSHFSPRSISSPPVRVSSLNLEKKPALLPLPVRLALGKPLGAGRRSHFSPRSISSPPVRVSSLNLEKKMSTSIDAASAAGEPARPPSDGGGGDQGDVIVQYVVLRRDLIDTWPLGSIVTQGCHASVAAICSNRDHPDTAAYCSESNLDSMRKVTLEVKGEAQLRNLSEKLEAGGIGHKLWIEQPENFPTCLATRPYPKSQVASFFRKLKLCK